MKAIVLALCSVAPAASLHRAAASSTTLRRTPFSLRAMSSLASGAEGRESKRMRTEDLPVMQAVKEAAVLSDLPPVDATTGARPKTIGTHDGKFHCDESLACAMLKLLPEWKDAVVVRTRKPDILAACDIVVDVGAVYDPEKLRFDHHQSTFSTTFEGQDKTKLSSAGLVYMHYGRQIISTVTQESPLPDHVSEVVFQRMYKKFIEHIDAIDNGVSVCEVGEPRYAVTTSLSSRVGYLFPQWNQDSSDVVVNECFRDAMVLTGSEFMQQLTTYQSSWWPARSLVEEALGKASEVHASGEIFVLEQVCPWQSHLFDVEEVQGKQGTFKYALYQDSRGMWRIQAVPAAEGSFQSRLALPEQWRGLRDGDLSAACGIDGATFVHASGFIGGHATFEGVLQMATASLAMGAGK